MIRAPADLEVQAQEACENEPIRTPEACQPHGCIVVCDQRFETITHLSQNAGEYFGRSVDEILAKPLMALLSASPLHALRNAASLRTFSLQREYLGEFEIACGLVGIAAHMRDENVIIEVAHHSDDRRNHDVDINRLRWLMPRWTPESQTLMDTLVLTVNDLRTLTGFDRVMAYRFRPDYSGEVVAESLAPKTESFLGLRFPSWDIPKIARAISLEQPLRIISDIAADDVPLLAANSEMPAVDLTLAELRGTSPVHKTYLSNMGVQASLVLPVVVDGQLWGMFSLHHSKPRHFTIKQSLSLELVGQMLNMHMGHILERELAANVKSCHAIVEDLASQISAPATNTMQPQGWSQAATKLAKTLKLDGLLLKWGDATLLHGCSPQKAPVDIELSETGSSGIYASDHTKIVTNVEGVRPIVGVMRIDIDAASNSQIWLFRHEENQTVHWAGAPKKDIDRDESRLLPRSSFAAYVEQSSGKSRSWEPDDLTMARALQRALQNLFTREAERRAYSKDIGMVVNELNHRVRNVLSLVQSVVQRSTVGQQNVEDYAEALNRRILSLAKAHDLLSHDHGVGLDLRSAIKRELSPFDNSRFLLSGPDVMLDLESCTIFVLVFHEMVTNAAKYGALSADNGHIEIEWAVDKDVLTLRFVEWGGPPVKHPASRGFGSILIEDAIPHQLGGNAKMTFSPSGLRVDLKIPKKFLTALPTQVQDISQNEEDGIYETSDVKRHGLIVENNYLIGVEIGAMIRDLLGHQSQLVSNNAAALEVVEREVIHFAILDVNLADESCLETARLLHSKQIPFVFLTGYDADQDWMGEFGATPVISKPMRRDEFARIVGPLAMVGSPKEQLTFLLIEDHVALQKQLSTDIARLGHHVECASNVLEAETILDNRAIDAIILDVYIESGNKANTEGTLRIVSRIRNEIRNNYQVAKDVPILAISGGLEIPGGFSPLRMARQVGVSAWLSKPIPDGQLEKWIREIEVELIERRKS